MSKGQYNPSPITLSTQGMAELQLDINGNLLVGLKNGPSASPTLYTNFGTATSGNIKSTAGNVFSLLFTSTSTQVRYLQLFNEIPAPTPGDVPIYSFKIAAGTSTVPTSLLLPMGFFLTNTSQFPLGISWAVSTQQATFVNSATANQHDLHLEYL